MDNPWLRLPKEPPYVLESDCSLITAFNSGQKDEFEIQTDLLPEPYIGNVDAPVVFLNMNPGFSEADRSVHARPSFQRAVLANLRHEPQDNPYYYLNPSEDGPGYEWCRKHQLARILERVPEKVVASRILLVEYFAYHSQQFSPSTPQVLSQKYSFDILRRAVRRRALVVILRAKRHWLKAVPELEELQESDRLFELWNPRCRMVWEGNCPDGFEEIVRALSDCPTPV